MTVTSVDPELKTYATEAEWERLDAINKHGSQLAAAAALGVNEASVRRTLLRVRTNAALAGYSPDFGLKNPIPLGQKLRGVSKLTDLRTGKDVMMWTKTSADDEQREVTMRAAAEAMALELPREKPVFAPAMTNARLCSVYTMTDCHVGMLAWGRETGEPWDLEIAERVLTGCFERMVAASPKSRVAIVNQIGDFLHSDGMKSVTPEHGHLLDSDGRFPKVVKVAVRVLRKLIAAALEKHQQVIVILGEGNHDPASSIWLRAMFAALYEDEPRVTINDSEYPYYAHQHGETMIAFHHGHLTDPSSVDRLFAAAFSKLWGETTKRYCHMGHKHHVHEKEFSGMTVFQHPTLAAKDAYAARGGWFAKRAANAVVYHDKYGEVGRITVCPEMVEDALAA